MTTKAVFLRGWVLTAALGRYAAACIGSSKAKENKNRVTIFLFTIVFLSISKGYAA